MEFEDLLQKLHWDCAIIGSLLCHSEIFLRNPHTLMPNLASVDTVQNQYQKYDS